MVDTEHAGSENLPPDGYLQPRRYKVTHRCLRCGKTFHEITTNPGGSSMACPKADCKEAAFQDRVMREAANLAKIILEQRAPGVIGDKVVVKAVDETARVVMEDYGMTDLRDNVRQGEPVAPKLPGQQQALADNYFGGNPLRSRGVQDKHMSAFAHRIRAKAIAGGYRMGTPSPRVMVPGKKGESPLWSTGIEKLKE